jgi:alpha-mannosidase
LNEFEKIGVDETASSSDCLIVFNQLPFTRTEIIKGLGPGNDSPILIENIPPFSFMSVDKSSATVKSASNPSKFCCQKVNGYYSMRNSFLEAKFDLKGRLYSLVDLESKLEVLQGPHVLKLYEDVPAFWDAWDVEVYHLEKGWTVDDTAEVSILESTPLIVSISRKIKISPSSEMIQVSDQLIDFFY